MSDPTLARIDQFLTFYNALSSENVGDVTKLYHAECIFVDPVQIIEGQDELMRYFQHAYARLSFCHFIATSVLQQGERDNVCWQMTFSHPAIGNGKQITVDGCSVLHWQQHQLIYHRDYYDLQQMVFRHLPVLGWLTDKIVRRMANETKN